MSFLKGLCVICGFISGQVADLDNRVIDEQLKTLTNQKRPALL